VRFVRGLRVTDAPTMELVKMVLVGKINKEIVAQLQVAGAPAVGLAGDDGGLIEAEKATSGGEDDLGFVGQVASIDPWVLESLAEFVPVVASVGVDRHGQSFNINADTVAGRLAAALGARKAIFLTDVEGIYRDIADPASLISECRLRDLRDLMEAGSVGAGMIPKLGAVADAIEGGVEAAHIVDGRVPHSVLVEIFTESGVGTKVTK
jgi:acetylglutamate kinase